MSAIPDPAAESQSTLPAGTVTFVEARFSATGTKEPSGVLDGFADAEEASLVITHPLRGYYRRRDGRIGTYAVAHSRLHMTRGIVHECHFAVFEDHDLIERGAAPHSVLLIPRTVSRSSYLRPH